MARPASDPVQPVSAASGDCPTSTTCWPATARRGPSRRCSIREAARSPDTTNSSMRQECPAILAELAECVGERGRGGLEHLRAVVRSLVDNDGISYVQLDNNGEAVTNGDGSARAWAVASRRTAAGDLGDRLGHPGIRSGAALAAARRGAGRSVRPAPLGDRRRVARRSCCSPIPAISGPRGGSRCRAGTSCSCTPATSAGRPTGCSGSTPTGPRRRRVRATHWPTGASSHTPSPISTSGSAPAPPRRGHRRCDWR